MYWVLMSDTLSQITVSSKTEINTVALKAMKPGTSSCDSKTSSALCYNECGQKLRKCIVGGLWGSSTNSMKNFKWFPILQTRILMLTEAKCVASHNLALSIWTEIPGAEVQPLTLTASNNHLVVLQWEALRKFRRLALQTSISLSVNQPSSCTCSLSPSPCLLLLLCVCACSLMYTWVKPWLWTCYVSYQ